MPDELDDIVDNLREPSAWIRILFMVGFAVGFYLVLVPLIGLLALVQALFAVISGEPNDNLRRFGEGLTRYVSEILQFLFYNRQEKPFPFSSLPVDDLDDDFVWEHPAAAEPAASSRSARKAPAKKAAAKKTPARKAAAKKSPVRKSAGKRKGGPGNTAPAAGAGAAAGKTTAPGSAAKSSDAGTAQGSAGQSDPGPADK